MSDQVLTLYYKYSSNLKNIREKFFIGSVVEDFFQHNFESYNFTAC